MLFTKYSLFITSFGPQFSGPHQPNPEVSINPSRNKIKILLIPLLLTLLTFFCLCTAQQGDQAPEESAIEEGSSPGERLEFVAFHIAGVLGAIFASFTRSSYASSIFYDRLMTIFFYISCIALAVDAIYVTYVYQSADMLLIGAAAGMILFELHMPRFWSIYARKLHMNSPMWRIRSGIIYKRTRESLTEDEKKDNYTWNGYEFNGELIDRTKIKKIVEGDPTHWERTIAHWQDFVVKGRIGKQAFRRAALALRMAFSVPMPALVKCGQSDYYAARGALGMEVMKTWEIGSLKDLLKCNLLLNKGKRAWENCEERFELAYFLHLQLLLHESNKREEEFEKKRLKALNRQGDSTPEDNTQTQNETRTEKNDDKDWTNQVTEWLFGELVVREVEQEEVKDALAFGFFGLKKKSGNNGNNGSKTTGNGADDASKRKCWYLVGKSSVDEYLDTLKKDEGGAQDGLNNPSEVAAKHVAVNMAQ